MDPYWSEAANGHPPHSVKYESEAAVSSFPYCTESSLNFSTSATAYSEDDGEYASGRRNKTSRQDPLSHRIIEKRRRDRMNSCLADLSRLIPPQYQRKGRGRIEKTEIIEMAIRHLKHLQSECMQRENEYRLGYTDCMKEAAKFLCDSQMQDFCYRLVTRLQERCDEVLKNECYKSRSCLGGAAASVTVVDNVSASSGSPHHQIYHHHANAPPPPLCQLRDMLGTASSDIEHSNDHNDVKDLSFRNQLNQLQRQQQATATSLSNGGSPTDDHHHNVTSNSTSSSAITSNNNNPTSSTSGNGGGSAANSVSLTTAGQQQPHQAAVITSTAPSATLLQHHHSHNHHHHTDSSNHDHDFDSSRDIHTDTSNMHSPPPRDSLQLHHHHHHNGGGHHHLHDSLLSSSGRLRNFSESSSHDIEHNNNYKYKNHIKERFNHELHDEETSSEHGPTAPLLQSEHSQHTHSLSEHSKDGHEPEIAPIMAKKRKLAEEAAAAAEGSTALNNVDERQLPSIPRSATTITGLLARAADDKPVFTFGDIKTEINVAAAANSGGSAGGLLHSKSQHLSHTPSSTSAPASAHPRTSFAVPIFALHSQGTYYVPLNVDYSVLLPFLNGVDLLEKNYSSMPVVHPININVNFMSPTPSVSLLGAAVAAAAAAVAAGKQHPTVVNGNVSSTAKAKLEAITNGW